MSGFPVSRADELDALSQEPRWLVEGLWADRAVGVIGGEPKCCKSFLALEIAVSVASGAPCLGRFRIPRPGRVLLFAAEDALRVVRTRIEGIARIRGVPFAGIAIHVITAPTIRVDLTDDRKKLRETVEAIGPTLLVLDPFIRLHRADENAATDVAPLLAYLREIERCFGVCVLVVHHARKGAGHARAGQALRGSSEFHSWGDSNLYLRRKDNLLFLGVEHRAAPSAEDIRLELAGSEEEGLALRILDEPGLEQHFRLSVGDRIRRALKNAQGPLTLRQLRETCRVRTTTLCESLSSMVALGDIRKDAGRYLLVR